MKNIYCVSVYDDESNQLVTKAVLADSDIDAMKQAIKQTCSIDSDLPEEEQDDIRLDFYQWVDELPNTMVELISALDLAGYVATKPTPLFPSLTEEQNTILFDIIDVNNVSPLIDISKVFDVNKEERNEDAENV